MRRLGYTAKKTGRSARPDRISEDCGEQIEKVILNVRCLFEKGWLKRRIVGLGRGRGMVDTTEVEITPKGIDEYQRTHEIDKDK